MNKLLLVEDDPDIVKLLEHHFLVAGYQVISSTTGADAIKKALENKFDLIILDIMLPDMDGFAICRILRGKEVKIPVMMLTSRGDEFDKVLALELGADDYVTKPFSIRELVARVKALLRRSSRSQAEPVLGEKEIQIKALSINRDNRKATLNGGRIDLTAKEFELLYLMASHKGKTFSRFELLEAVWGLSFTGYEHTITSHINRLRLKIEPDIHAPEYILTTWGTGYRFCE